MSSRTKKVAVAVLVMALLLIGIVGAAQAQTQTDPANPPAAAPNRLQQMQERLGSEAYGQMIQRMTEHHGAEEAGKMLQRMASADAECDGIGQHEIMGMGGHSGGMMGRSGGIMNGFQRGMGRLMGSWH